MKRQRKAFSIMTALFIIIIMASVGVFISNLSGKIGKETLTQYQREQAMLLAKSYTELAIMTVMTNNRRGTSSCINTVDGNVTGAVGSSTTGEGYDVTTHIGFIGNSTEIASCAAVSRLGNPVTFSAAADADKADLNIVVDVYVRYKDITQLNPAASPWITYHRRTLQKI